jgi:hypothetical protein
LGGGVSIRGGAAISNSAVVTTGSDGCAEGVIAVIDAGVTAGAQVGQWSHNASPDFGMPSSEVAGEFSTAALAATA